MKSPFCWYHHHLTEFNILFHQTRVRSVNFQLLTVVFEMGFFFSGDQFFRNWNWLRQPLRNGPISKLKLCLSFSTVKRLASRLSFILFLYVLPPLVLRCGRSSFVEFSIMNRKIEQTFSFVYEDWGVCVSVWVRVWVEGYVTQWIRRINKCRILFFVLFGLWLHTPTPTPLFYLLFIFFIIPQNPLDSIE